MQPTRSRTQKNQVADRTGVRRRPYKARRVSWDSAGEVVLFTCGGSIAVCGMGSATGPTLVMGAGGGLCILCAACISRMAIEFAGVSSVRLCAMITEFF